MNHANKPLVPAQLPHIPAQRIPSAAFVVCVVLLIAFALVGVCLLSGCQTDPATGKKSNGYWWSQHGSQVAATAGVVGAEALKIGLGTLMNSAGNQNGDWNHSIAEGLRENMTSIDVSDDVARIARIWGPPTPQGAQAAQQLAQIYAQAAPQTQAQSVKVVEQIAEGIQQAAGKD